MIVPVYKVEKYIRKCIDSILVQTFAGFELILIDDGSPDNCPIIIDGYSKGDWRIVPIHQENRGVSAARNAGLKKARGKYICFVDPDDYVENTFLESLICILIKHNADIACCNWRYFSETGEREHKVPNVPETMGREEWLLHYFDMPRSIGGSNCNKLFRKELISLYYDENMRICEDNWFLINYSVKINKACFINASLYNTNERWDSAIRANPSRVVEGLHVRENIVFLMREQNKKLFGKAEADYLDTIYGLHKAYGTADNEKVMEPGHRFLMYIKRTYGHFLFNGFIPWKLKVIYLIELLKICN